MNHAGGQRVGNRQPGSTATKGQTNAGRSVVPNRAGVTESLGAVIVVAVKSTEYVTLIGLKSRWRLKRAPSLEHSVPELVVNRCIGGKIEQPRREPNRSDEIRSDRIGSHHITSYQTTYPTRPNRARPGKKEQKGERQNTPHGNGAATRKGRGTQGRTWTPMIPKMKKMNRHIRNTLKSAGMDASMD